MIFRRPRVFRSLLAVVFFSAALRGFAAGEAPSSNAIADAAYEAFTRSEWKTAIDGYEKLLARGVTDPGVLFNLGTSYAKAGEAGRATWALLLARRMAPRDADIRANLAVVSPNATSQIAVFPIPPLEFSFQLLTMNEWAWVGWLATVSGALLLAFYFRKTVRGASWGLVTLRKLAVFLLVVAAVAHFFASAKYATEVYKTRGVVVARSTYPHMAPNDGSPAYEFTLPPGTVIGVGEAGAPGWVKAIYGGRNEVFIKRDQMEYLRLPGKRDQRADL